MLWYPGCAGWHGTSNSNWVSGTNGFIRGNGGVFSFNNNTWTNNTNMGRGVAVVGTGLYIEYQRGKLQGVFRVYLYERNIIPS